MSYADIVGESQMQGNIPGLPQNTIVRADPRTARTLYVAAPSASIAAGATATFQIQVQVPIRLDQLVIVDETNSTLTTLRVTGIRVGPANQIVSNGGSLPAAMFGPQSFNTNTLQGNTALPGTDILVTIDNPALAAAVVTVAAKGIALTA